MTPPMSDLTLDSLRIQNFRTFKDLEIDHLGLEYAVRSHTDVR